MKKLITIRIESTIWQEFKRKYEKVGLSSKIRELILKELNWTSNSNEVMVKKLDWKTLQKLIFVDFGDLPVQIVGPPAVGKSLSIKELIKNDKSHRFFVFDPHDEYSEIPQVTMLSGEIKGNVRIVLPRQPSVSRSLFSLYSAQILSQKWDPDVVFILEESHRYHEAKLLLREGRKFAKIIAISQEPLASFCPIIRIIP